MRTHYQTLGIPNLSGMPEIKKAYRALALRHHPDRGGDVKRMQEINAAYEYLAKNKAAYDLTLRPSRPVLRTYGFTIVVDGANVATSMGPDSMKDWMAEAMAKNGWANRTTTGGF